MKPPRLAIVGIGCLFPKANSLDAYWANIKNRVDAITEVPETHWRTEDYFDGDPAVPDRTYVKRGGFLTPVEFNPMEFGVPPNAIEATDTSQLLGVHVARATLEDAGYGESRTFDRDRVSVILGVTGALELVIPLGARLGHPIWRRALAESGIEGSLADEIVERIASGYVPWQENSFPGLLGNVVAGRIANRLNLGGTNCVVDAACASSLSALHMATLELQAGRCDMAICGGVDSFNDIFMFMCFSKTPALSPTGEARPFDRGADGTLIGEGIGMLAIKRLEDAVRAGDRIYAVVRGIGTSSDGKGSAIYAPTASGQSKALRDCYRVAEISPDTIELVEAHGTGTSVGDAVELEALSEVYRSARGSGTWCALGSVKSQIGHTKAAAGVAGLVKIAMALKHKVLPPTLKVTRPIEPLANETCPFYVNVENRPWVARAEHPRRAAVSSFGFGGSNFHCVLEEHEDEKTEIDWDGDVQILAFSAPDRDALKARLALQAESWELLREEAARLRASFDPDHATRLLVVVERGKTDPAEMLASAKRMIDSRAFWSAPGGIFFGSGEAPGKLAFLFPGQGSQYAGMMRDLACQFPQMLEALGEADETFSEERTARLSDLIYPHPAFDDARRAKEEAALRATDVAQPAIGAVSLGALGVLAHFGVQPEAVAGHSYGELTALCAAGRFDARALHTLSNLRGRLMARPNGDAGSMLAVQAPLARVEETIRSEKLDLVIANKNAPTQAVLSGRTVEIERAAEIFSAREIRNQRLPVAAAFHSPLVAEAREPFASALEGIPFRRAKIPVFANSSADAYPAAARSARRLLAGQMARPVEFVSQIEAMARSGVGLFVEVGPGARLTGLVRSILEGKPHVAIALDASSGKRSGTYDLAYVLAQLTALGLKINLAGWDDGVKPRKRSAVGKKPVMTVPIGGANTFKPPSRPAKLRAPALRQGAGSVLHQQMAALQKIQEETAKLHRQFLEGQDAAQRSIQMLIEQQQGVIRKEPKPEPKPEPEVAAPKPPPVKPPAPTDGTAEVLLAVVAEKTGYPTEMLDLDMGLDSDLGIDSIKRVEILSALREKLPGAPVVKPEHLGAFQTLRDVVNFLSAAKPKPKPLEKGIAPLLLEVVSEKTGYPVEMLNLDMGLDSDLGIDSIKRVEILSALRERIPEAPVVKPEHLGRLQTLRQVAEFLAAPSIAAPSTAVPAQTVVRFVLEPVPLETVAGRKTVSIATGTDVWVTDDGSQLGTNVVEQLRSLGFQSKLIPVRAFGDMAPPERLGALVILAPAATADDAFLMDAFRLLQFTGPGLRRAGSALLVTVSRMDGAFGLGDLESDPTSGGLAGLSKTVSHEWPEVGCKAIDLASGFGDLQEAASKLVQEMFLEGPPEVGISRTDDCTLRLRPVPLPRADPDALLSANDVVVISGGARGVTAEAAVALAGAFQPTLLLLGRSPLPEAEDERLSRLETEAEIKKELAARAGGRVSPKEIGEACRRVMAGREIRANIRRMEEKGSTVLYRSVDVRDVAALTRELRGKPIRGLIHGAGVLADRLIEEKTQEQFDRVYGTKVAGLRALLEALRHEPLRFIALFSSTTARYGRRGQVDYAVANEVLNKLAHREAQHRPDCRVVSINWGPWDGGMVTPAHRRVFEGEGVALIPPQVGGEVLVREIRARGGSIEVVILGAGSAIPLARKPSAPAARPDRPETALTTVVEHELTVERFPFLKSHVMDGHALLPMAIFAEWLAHAALHGNPGMVFHGFDALRILKGVILDRDGSVTIRILAGKAVKEGSSFVVPVELHSSTEGRSSLNASASIILVPGLPNAPAAADPGELELQPYRRTRDEFYGRLLFHGPDFQGIREVEGSSHEGIIATARGAPPPSDWIAQPLRGAWLTDPLVLDASFQMMILWCIEHRGTGSLPCHAGRYRQYRSAFPKGGVRIVSRIKSATDQQVVADIDFLDEQEGLVARIEDYECVMSASLEKAFRRNRLEPDTSHVSTPSRSE